MDDIINDILNYIDYLQKHHGLNITVHGSVQKFAPLKYKFVNQNIHHVPYCLAVKSNRAAWDNCILCQEKVYKKCRLGSPFWGMCYAGVEEYITPILNDQAIGFISVSGYRINPEKALPRIRKVADVYVLNYEDLLALYTSSLKDVPPDDAYLRTLLQPLAYMIEKLCEMAVKLYPVNQITQCNADYIYSKVIQYLNKNFASKVSVADITELCHCSESYINHLFKKRSGKNISAYVNSLRVEEAKKLLRGSHLSISEISGMTGFSDSNYFSTVFKKTNGISPANYRGTGKDLKT